ncbi:MAG: TraR/DksA C4-type zinc finger protein [Gammaproteobacteria bacterium]|nr:TraR/DksA C4-type zinc finger protein [Gammaproteobacteria bacterium]
MTDHDEIRARLANRRAELKQRLNEIKEDVRHTEKPLEQDFAEQAVERENEEVLDALGEAARMEIAAIQKAFVHIDRDEYGICAICGRTIPKERLEVLPYSDRCVTCAEKSDLIR